MFLALIFFDARAAQGFFQAAPAQFAIIFVLGHAEVDIACQLIGIAPFAQTLHHLNDFRHRLANLGVDIGGHDIQFVEMAQIFVGIVIGQRDGVFAPFIGAANDLVIDIGKVGDIAHLITAIDEIAAHHVKNNRRHGMTDVRVGVDGRAANIHAHLARFHGLKLLRLAGERVVDAKRHENRSYL